MNTAPSCASSPSPLRRAAILAGGTLLLAVSCTTPEGPEGNIFAPGQSRYGYGGTQTLPQNTAPTKRTDGRKVPDIRRDPNNTTVDVTPPESKVKPDDTAAAAGATETTTTETTTTEPPVEPAAPKPATPREDLPYGQPVVGSKGYVFSPYAPDAGHVDVRDIPAGTKVKCPYTNKVFRVP